MKSLKKGFTLVELMVVIVIIGILAALAIPRFLGATNKTKATEFKPVLKQLYTLQEAYLQEKSVYSADKATIGFEDPNASARYFDYTALAPTPATSKAAEPGVIVGKATPNTKGQTIKTPGGTALTTGDFACVDAAGTQSTATDSLAVVSSVSKDATNCK